MIWLIGCGVPLFVIIAFFIGDQAEERETVLVKLGIGGVVLASIVVVIALACGFVYGMSQVL